MNCEELRIYWKKEKGREQLTKKLLTLTLKLRFLKSEKQIDGFLVCECYSLEKILYSPLSYKENL